MIVRNLPLLAILTALQAVPLPPVQVPSALLPAAEKEPFSFVMSLADASIPAGFEVQASRWILPQLRPDFDVAHEPTLPVLNLVQIFNAHQGEYTATAIGGVVVVRPATRTAAYLDRPSALGRVTVTGVTTAAKLVFSGLDPSLAIPPTGMIMSGGGGDRRLRAEQMLISLDGPGRSNLELLNDIVKQASCAWYVVSSDGDAPSPLQFGFIYGNGSTSHTVIDAPPAGR